MLRESYDVPISLTLAELDKLRVADVPENLRETRDAFVLQCSIGCRIGDFQKISMDNVDVVDGVPFVHYLPTKTARQSRQELPTPLIPFAVDIINKYGFHFKILHNISGKDGYNSKIKKLIQYCKIDRLCSVYDEREKTEIRKPLYEIASSKLARKTFVNLCATCQVDMYASGLHSRSSNAVERYAHIDIQERYRLICYAFNQPLIKVDDNLQPLTNEKPTDRITAIIAGLSESEKNKLRELLGSNQ